MINSDLIGKIVSFDTYAQYILGDKFTRCKVVGILDAETARHYHDIEALSIAIYSTLPEGTIKDYTQYQYLKVKLSNGNSTVVAIPWIKKDTLTIHTDVAINIRIDGINVSDIDTIRGILLAYNYNQLTITQL